MEAEIPEAILWIASIGLIILTVMVTILVIVLVIIAVRVKKLIGKANEIAEPIKDAANQLGNTVASYSKTALSPLASVMGAVAGFRRGLGMFGGKRRGK